MSPTRTKPTKRWRRVPDGNRFAGLSDALDDDSESNSEEDERRAEKNEGTAEADEESAEAANPAAEGDDGSDATDTAAESVGTTGDAAGTTDETTAETVGSADADDTADADEASDPSGPAFSFEETTPKSIYVRDETLDVLEDAEFDVESVLRREYDVRDVTGREFHDAVVRLAADHVDDIAARVVEAREK